MSNDKYITAVTPVGRMVGGDLYTPNDKDYQGNPLTYKQGPNIGQPKKEWVVLLAVSKTDPNVQPALKEFFTAIHAASAQFYPTIFDQNTKQLLNAATPFSFKYFDGDSQEPNENGKRPCDNEHFRGHWVFRFVTSSENFDIMDQNRQDLITPGAVKRGYYIRLAATIGSNNSAGKQQGIKLYFNGVQLCGIGEEIQGGSSKQAFEAAAPIPAGYDTPATPAAETPATPPMAAEPAATPGVPATQGAPAVPPQAAPAETPTTQVTPAPDFMNPQGATPAAPPAAPSTPTMTPAAGGATYESFIAAGWTPDQMLASGYITSLPS